MDLSNQVYINQKHKLLIMFIDGVRREIDAV
jgi:hypothetical protein